MSASERREKYAHTSFASTPLHRVLAKLRERFAKEAQPDELVIPYVLTCAVYLEAKLNDELFHFAITNYGEEVATALVSLSLPKKLLVVVPTLTKGQYSINKGHFVYGRLATLVRVRNSIAHAKTEFEEISAEDYALAGAPSFQLGSAQRQKKVARNRSIDLTMGSAKPFSPMQYHEALEKFEKWFFQKYPNRLSKVAMVVREEHGHWQPDAVQLVKFLD